MRKIPLLIAIFGWVIVGCAQALIIDEAAKDEAVYQQLVEARKSVEAQKEEYMVGGEIEAPDKETAPTPLSPPPLTPSPSPPPSNKAVVAIGLLGAVAIVSGVYSVILMKRK